MNIINLFKRSTSSASFVPEIDGLRFFCIFLVMIFHLNTAMHKSDPEIGLYWNQLLQNKQIGNLTWWVVRLDLGVKVFFAISGYILGMPFLKQYLYGGRKINLKEYFIRRLTRLEPPFIITLLVFTLANIVIMHKPAMESIKHSLAGIFYAHVPIYGKPNPINPVTWSLETEAQFYIALPLFMGILFLFKKKGQQLVALISMTVLFLFLKYLINTNQWSHVSNSIFYYFLFFAVGTFYAAAQLSNPIFFFNGEKKYSFDILGLIGMLSLFIFYKPQNNLLYNVLFNVGVFGLFLGVFRGKLLNWFFTRPLIYLIGGMCYTIYLLHYALFSFIMPHTIKLSFHTGYWTDLALQVLIVFPIVLLICGVFYLLVEKPCMNKDWPKQLMSFLGLRRNTNSH